MTNPESGTVTVRHNLVVWTMTAPEARELADFMEETLDRSDDLAHRDCTALREAADLIDGRSPTNEPR